MNFSGLTLSKIVLFAILFILLLFFVIPAINGIRNLGNIAGMMITAVLLFIVLKSGMIMNFISHLSESNKGKILLAVMGVIVSIGVIIVLVINVFMVRAMNDYPKNKNSTIVVLGCQVKEGRPSLMLKRRLDSAFEYLSENPEVKVIVSGGKGEDELISEAECMKTYLTEKGISPNRIFIEDNSSSTYENLKFSQKVIEENALYQNITIVTDGYHQLRAEMIAENLGYENTSNISAPTSWGLLPTFWVREWFGVIYYFVSK